MNIRSTMVTESTGKEEVDDDILTQEKNKKYKALRQNKIGSDSYMARGA
jgi:hypothetical protein